MDEPGPSAPFLREDLPRELWPIAAALDRMLGRIVESYGRERRFSANVAHELRTPLAALRIELDVALQRDRDAALTLRAGEGRSTLVVTNLLANAVDHEPPGSTVTVRVGQGAAALEITNAGGPLPDETLARAFDPFWRGEPARAGHGSHSGLGLPLARALARADGLDVRLAGAGPLVVATLVDPTRAQAGSASG